jgi:nitrous oxidase accessory protein NosD
LVEGNALFGPFNATTEALRVAIFGGNGTVGGVIRRNQVSGSGTEGGILLATYMLETGEVTGNLVHGASFGLLLQQGLATGFAARVYLNDFTGSTSRAIGVLGAYTLPTELSWEGLGNYWEHEAPPCFRLSDTPLPALIQDSHAACAPVAASNTSGR